MKLLSASHRITHVPGKELRVVARPGLGVCVGFLFLAVLTLGCLVAAVATQQWEPLWGVFVFGVWAWLLGVLVWMEWSELCVPLRGGDVTWRDGLKQGCLPAERVLGAMVDTYIQPRIHKGPGPTAFLGVWICDADLARREGVYPWRRLLSLNAGSYSALQVHLEFERLQGALKELGYDDQAAVEAKLKRAIGEV